MTAATHKMKGKGIIHPHTSPTWPPSKGEPTEAAKGWDRLPEARIKESVEETPLRTAIIEKENATVSMTFEMQHECATNKTCRITYGELSSELALVP